MPSPAQPGDYILVTPFSKARATVGTASTREVARRLCPGVGSAPRRRESSVEEESTRTTPIDV